jgi:hypothetical protein
MSCLYCLKVTSRGSSHSVAMVRHVMEKVREIVSYLNQNHNPFINVEQFKLYILDSVAKQGHWQWPDQKGEDKFVI